MIKQNSNTKLKQNKIIFKRADKDEDKLILSDYKFKKKTFAKPVQACESIQAPALEIQVNSQKQNFKNNLTQSNQVNHTNEQKQQPLAPFKPINGFLQNKNSSKNDQFEILSNEQAKKTIFRQNPLINQIQMQKTIDSDVVINYKDFPNLEKYQKKQKQDYSIILYQEIQNILQQNRENFEVFSNIKPIPKQKNPLFEKKNNFKKKGDYDKQPQFQKYKQTINNFNLNHTKQAHLFGYQSQIFDSSQNNYADNEKDFDIQNIQPANICFNQKQNQLNNFGQFFKNTPPSQFVIPPQEIKLNHNNLLPILNISTDHIQQLQEFENKIKEQEVELLTQNQMIMEQQDQKLKQLLQETDLKKILQNFKYKNLKSLSNLVYQRIFHLFFKCLKKQLLSKELTTSEKVIIFHHSGSIQIKLPRSNQFRNALNDPRIHFRK